MSPRDNKIVFAVSQTADGPLIAVGVPAGAWDYMKDGKTHHFDLNAMGIPFRLMMFGGPTHAACMEMFEKAAKESGAALLDQRNQDFGIKGVNSDGDGTV